MLQRLEFKRQLENDTKVLKKYDEKKKSRLVITSQETVPSDWIHQNQAGCSFWVHKSTGEVQTTPPHPLTGPKVERERMRSSQSQQEQKTFSLSQSSFDVTDVGSPEDTDATGSLVYDSKEYQDLMDVLGDI